MAKKEINHTERAHALLSASGSQRWLNCTPSARIEEKFDEVSSTHAQEGTLAHEFADLDLRFRAGELSAKVVSTEIRKLEKHALYTKEMRPQVAKYVDHVMEVYSEAKTRTPDALIQIEERLDFSHIVERGFGTGDACIVADGVLDVIDLKYGKGVQVDAPNNSQLMLYGSGSLRAFDLIYDIHTVRLTIVQPRLDHISTWEISADELRLWGEETVKPKAAEAYAGDGELVAGDWCKFCKAKAMCRALADKNMEMARHEFKDPRTLEDWEVVDVYKQLPMLQEWAKSVTAHMLNKALEGQKWKGYKVVEGRSQRRIPNPDKAIEFLRGLGHKDEDILKINLEGIGNLEALMGKSGFAEKMAPFITRAPGAPTLTSESDPRPEFGPDQARNDFLE